MRNYYWPFRLWLSGRKLAFVELNGGLGNQLYAISTAYYLKRNHDFQIVFDSQGCDMSTTSHGSLQVIEIIDRLFEGYIIRKKTTLQKMLHLVTKKTINPQYISRDLLYKYAKEKCVSGQSIFVPSIQDSFFANEALKAGLNYELMAIRRDMIEKWEQDLRTSQGRISISDIENSTVIHVRGTDMKSETRFVGVDWYQKAANNFPGKRFIIFSDDLQLAESLQSKLQYSEVFISTGSALIDLMIASCGKKCILSNSTFSFWVGSIGIESKNVISPALEGSLYWPSGSSSLVQ